jgi:hypothetical protein
MMILGFTESASWPDLLLIYATPRPLAVFFVSARPARKTKRWRASQPYQKSAAQMA